MKIQIENLKAQMTGKELNIHQKADALIEFNKLLDYVDELEQLTIPVVEEQSGQLVCNECGDTGRAYPTLAEPDGVECEKCKASEQLVCPNCDGEGFSGKGTNEILPCLSCFGSGEKALSIADVMPSGFTLKQENAIWSIIQYLAKEQFKNPRRVYKRKDVFDLIKAEMDW